MDRKFFLWEGKKKERTSSDLFSVVTCFDLVFDGEDEDSRLGGPVIGAVLTKRANNCIAQLSHRGSEIYSPKPQQVGDSSSEPAPPLRCPSYYLTSHNSDEPRVRVPPWSPTLFARSS